MFLAGLVSSMAPKQAKSRVRGGLVPGLAPNALGVAALFLDPVTWTLPRMYGGVLVGA